MRVKAGVQLDGVHFMLFYVAAMFDYLRQSNGLPEGTITGGREPADRFGPARVSTTYHPAGRALDFRISDMAPTWRSYFVETLQESLGSDFRVVLESDHIHVEFRGVVSFT